MELAKELEVGVCLWRLGIENVWGCECEQGWFLAERAVES